MGLLEGIVEAGVAALGGKAVAAAVGPGIGPCCYEVGAGHRGRPYRARFGRDVVRGSNLDLWTAAERAAARCRRRLGRASRPVHGVQPSGFFSHRRDRGATGRQGVIGYVA